MDLVNLRAGPGENYPILELLPADETVRLLSRNETGDWLYISSTVGDGWVASWLLDLDRDMQTLAVQAAPPTPVSRDLQPTATQAPVATATQAPVATATQAPVATATQAPVAAATQAPVVTAISVPTLVPVLVETTPTATPAGALLTDDFAHPCLVSGYFWLIHPVDITVRNEVTFQWGFSGQLPAGCGFEVLLWRVGDPPRGVHDAVADNLNNVIKLSRANEYRLEIPFLNQLPSTAVGSGDYNWTVAIVQVSPQYRSFGRQADPAYVRIELP